ncbi:MAG: hypothetical protein ABF384_05905 [Verrucomicrobiales bacterium]
MERIYQGESELIPEFEMVTDHLTNPKLPPDLRARIRNARKSLDRMK